MLTETDLELDDDRTLHVYETASDTADVALFWHHGTPNIGSPPEPLFAAANELGFRWISYDRPGYGGSSPQPGRTVASAAVDVAAIADALGIERLALMGHSGGGTFALASAALLGERVLGSVCMAGLAPFGAEGFDWFNGMVPSGEGELRAAISGRAALEDYVASMEFDPEMFTPADRASLGGEWSWLNDVVKRGMEGGLDGMVDDDLSYARPWGFEPADIWRPVLLVYGEDDRIVPSSHGEWLAGQISSSELWLRPGDGHISVLRSAAAALRWLRSAIDGE